MYNFTEVPVCEIDKFSEAQGIFFQTSAWASFKDKYKNINYLGMCNKLELNRLNLEKDYEIYSYNDLTKNYSQDRKTFDLIQNKFQDLNLNLMMVIDNNKFVDSLILFEISFFIS